MTGKSNIPSHNSGRVKEGQIYIASIWNNKDDPKNGFGGVHTFEIVYSPQSDINNPWTVYNRNASLSKMEYETLSDILKDRTEGAYISLLKTASAKG